MKVNHKHSCPEWDYMSISPGDPEFECCTCKETKMGRCGRFLFRFYDYKRKIKWFFQRHFRGWSDNEVWDLQYHIAARFLPPLKKLRDNHFGRPGSLTTQEWNEILDKIVFAFEKIKEDRIEDSEENAKIQEGCELFGKYFRCLWD